MSYVIGLDVGGTFTDCVVIDEHGNVVTDKAFSTPDNAARGMIQAIGNAAQALGTPLPQLFQQTSTLALGTTILTNLLIKRAGARVGLLTSKGHEDAVLIGRVLAKTEGLPEGEKLDILAWDKPAPLVPKALIRGVTERVDYKGAVLVPLSEAEVERAVDELVDGGVEALAVCFLWSFLNPGHEQRAREIIARKHPRLFIALSSDVAPVIGEYERALTTVMNGYLGPVALHHTRLMREAFSEQGFAHQILVMQSNGGVIWDEEVPLRPVNILASGPVGGVTETAKVGAALGYPNVIATDMGGTSFDVGLVVAGQAHLADTVLYERFRMHVPVVEVMSIGAGGGSIAWIDPLTRTLHVGPNSAGSLPGPVCYERGGTEPTVTDADIVLNRISAESFFGGRQSLNRERALKAIEEKIAAPLGYDPIRAAKGIVDIVDARMADLIRKLTVERGLDPRDFVIFSYGGAGPVHVGAYGRDIGVRLAVVSPYAPVFSALGIAASDITRHYTKSEPMNSPFDGERMTQVFQGLEDKALMDLRKSGVQDGYALHRSVNMRFRFQVHEIQVPVTSPLSSPAEVEALIARFRDLYEQTFGRGTGLKGAVVETLTFHVISVVPTQQALLKKLPSGGPDPGRALRGTRAVFWDDAFLGTPVYEQSRLGPGNRIAGPAIIEAPNTTILVHPGQRSWVDDYANVVVELEG